MWAPMSEATPKLVGTRELAEWLDISMSTLHRLRDAGEIPRGFKIGNQIRWPREEIAAWIEGTNHEGKHRQDTRASH